MSEELVVRRDVTLEQRFEEEGNLLLAQARALVVRDDASFRDAVAGGRRSREQERLIHELMDPICDAAHAAHKAATGRRALLLRYPSEARAIYDKAGSDYEQEQARVAREAEAAAQRERERLEAEARALAAAEQKRLQREAEDRALAAAVAAEQAGDTETAERILAAPVTAPIVTPAPVFTPPPPSIRAPRVEGVSYSDHWGDFEVENDALIPRQYLCPDVKKIGAVIRANKGNIIIPGIRVIKGRVTTQRL